MTIEGLGPALPGMQSAPTRAPHWRCIESAADHRQVIQSLGADDVHLWLVRRDRGPGALAVIARYARCEPDRLPIEFNTHGKPSLAGSTLAFNISHSGAQSLVAVGLGVRVGVDLEHSRRVSRRAALLARCFTVSERARIESGDEDALLRHWAAKEAVVKAIGRGIAYGLASIEIEEGSHGELRLAQLGGPAGPASAWRLTGGRIGRDGYFALAHDGHARVLSYYADGSPEG
jgi:4'-phosphopantetheinyl transferase